MTLLFYFGAVVSLETERKIINGKAREANMIIV